LRPLDDIVAAFLVRREASGNGVPEDSAEGTNSLIDLRQRVLLKQFAQFRDGGKTAAAEIGYSAAIRQRNTERTPAKMEPFFSLCGVVIIALWSADEVSQTVGGWVLPLLVGVGIFVLVSIAVFRDIDRISTILQGLGFGAIAGIALFRLVFLNTHTDADHLGGFIFGLGYFGLGWAMLTKMKNEIRQAACDERFRSR
jgi:hypothetical protein